MAKKKELLHKGRMSKPRCYIGYGGLELKTAHRFKEAFTKGTIYRPFPSDVVKVKVQPTFNGNLEELTSQLEACNGSKFIGAIGKCLIFHKPSEET